MMFRALLGKPTHEQCPFCNDRSTWLSASRKLSRELVTSTCLDESLRLTNRFRCFNEEGMLDSVDEEVCLRYGRHDLPMC